MIINGKHYTETEVAAKITGLEHAKAMQGAIIKALKGMLEKYGVKLDLHQYQDAAEAKVGEVVGVISFEEESKPTKHGYWKKDERYKFDVYVCSECESQAITEWNECGGEYALTSYCPHCGAKMT